MMIMNYYLLNTNHQTYRTFIKIIIIKLDMDSDGLQENLIKSVPVPNLILPNCGMTF